MSLDERFDVIEMMVRGEFSDVNLEFTRQVFAKHAEEWVYVLDRARFEEIQLLCQKIEKEAVAVQDPEIWILTKTWTGPWPGGDSEAEIHNARDLESRRNEFRLQYQLAGSVNHRA
jgi:hypothetical protein